MRVGEGLEGSGELQPEPMERALETLELYAHFCTATGIDEVRPVATSAIRDAANQAEFLRLARERSGLEVEVLPGPAEARYGYLAAVNSTTLSRRRRAGPRRRLDAAHPRGRSAGRRRALVAAGRRAHDRALRARARRSAPRRCASTSRRSWRARRGWATTAVWSAVGGTVRNLAAAAQLAAGLPSYGIQGYFVSREALGELIEEFSSLDPAERGEVAGIKASRGDLILAGALVIDGVLEAGGFAGFEATEAGLREGVFFERLYPDGAVQRRPPRRRAQPRRPVRHRLRPLRARRPAGAGDVGRARRGRACTRATRRSASSCGRPRCSTTSASPSTTTTTTSTPAT